MDFLLLWPHTHAHARTHTHLHPPCSLLPGPPLRCPDLGGGKKGRGGGGWMQCPVLLLHPARLNNNSSNGLQMWLCSANKFFVNLADMGGLGVLKREVAEQAGSFGDYLHLWVWMCTHECVCSSVHICPCLRTRIHDLVREPFRVLCAHMHLRVCVCVFVCPI